jgi:tetratricopeptide (TPR) repeat protein
VYYRLSRYFAVERKYDTALDYYLKAKQRGEKLYSLEQEAGINIGIGSVYVNKGNPKLGIEYLQKGYQIAKEINLVYLFLMQPTI